MSFLVGAHADLVDSILVKNVGAVQDNPVHEGVV